MQCAALTRSGKQCKASVWKHGLCFFHQGQEMAKKSKRNTAKDADDIDDEDKQQESKQ